MNTFVLSSKAQWPVQHQDGMLRVGSCALARTAQIRRLRWHAKSPVLLRCTGRKQTTAADAHTKSYSMTPRVLSIQSHTVHGYGKAAAMTLCKDLLLFSPDAQLSCACSGKSLLCIPPTAVGIGGGFHQLCTVLKPHRCAP